MIGYLPQTGDDPAMQLNHSARKHSLAEWLESTQSVSPTPGDYHNWAEQWAIDSAQQALKNLQRYIQFNAATIEGQRLRITVQLPSGYIETSRAPGTGRIAEGFIKEAYPKQYDLSFRKSPKFS